MSEKPMTGKDVFKRTIPIAIAILLIAIIAIIVMSVKNCGNKTPQLKNSDETYVEIGDLKVSKERLYTYMKQQYGMSELLRLVDNQLYAKEMAAVSQEDLDKYTLFDLSMVSRLDYYDGIMLKGYFRNLYKEILSGGRYDGLTESFGRRVPAIGFTIYFDALMEAINR